MSLTARLRGRLARGMRTSGDASGDLKVASMIAALARSGPAPLRDHGPPSSGPASIAIVIPSFRRGSGGHMTIVHLARALREMGHSISLWLEDSAGWHAGESESLLQQRFDDFFAADGLPLRCGFDSWEGADFVIATGWQTAPRVQLLPGAGARAYLVQDHEPDFYPVSAESMWAAETYRYGLHCVAASPWLADLLRQRYGAQASHFDLALDHSVYRPSDDPRDPHLVVLYARSSTPRRAVPIGLLALSALAGRRADLKLATFGQDAHEPLDFECEQLGVLSGRECAALYGRASVGVVLSLTNPSLVCLEMMACGLPCVEAASEPMLASFTADGPLRLAEPTPEALASAIEALLEDEQARETASGGGIHLAAERTWQTAAEQVLAGLRQAAAP